MLSYAAALEYLKSRTKTKQDRKRLSGEVFTPAPLAEEMLDSLPSDVWSHSNKRWLDPCVGTGLFPVLVYFRLMHGLRKSKGLTSPKKRSKHIIENMIRCVEIDDINVATTKSVFKLIDPDATPSVACYDFLEWNSPEKYDVVVGNPPYNVNGLNKGGAFLVSYWVPFVTKSVDLLESGGFLCFVHPPGWRKPAGETRSSGDVWKLFRERGSLLYLRVDDTRRPPFPEIDHYVFQNSKLKKRKAMTMTNTVFRSKPYKHTLRLDDMAFIPSLITPHCIRAIKKIIAVGPKLTFARDHRFRYGAKECTGKIKHVHYFEEGDGKLHTLDITSKQVSVMYPSGIPEFYNKPKIVVAHNHAYRIPKLYPTFFPENSNVGVTTNVAYQTIKKRHASRFLSYLDSYPVRFLLAVTQYSALPNAKNDIKVLNSLPDPAACSVPTGNKKLREFFGFTDDEEALVMRLGLPTSNG